jgi:hypothetical protein
MRTDWDKTTTRRPSRNAEIIYELVTANARDLAALRTHGCPVGVYRANLSVSRSLPVCPQLRTFSAPIGMSQRCQQATSNVRLN